jgi:hypothetical protein
MRSDEGSKFEYFPLAAVYAPLRCTLKIAKENEHRPDSTLQTDLMGMLPWIMSKAIEKRLENRAGFDLFSALHG